MQHLNVKRMKKHTLGFTWNSKVVTAIKLKMKLFHSLTVSASMRVVGPFRKEMVLEQWLRIWQTEKEF